MELFSAYMAREYEFFDTAKPGELMSRLTNDTDAISNSAEHLVKFISGAIMLVGGFGFLLYLNWKLSLVMLAVTPVIGVVTWLLSRANERTSELALTAQARSVTVADEVLSNLPAVFGYKTQAYEQNRFSRNAFITYLLKRRQALMNHSGDFVIFAVFNYIAIGTMFYAGSLVLEGKASVSNTVTFLLIVFDLTNEFEDLPEALYSLAAGVGASQRIARHVAEAAVVRQQDKVRVAAERQSDAAIDLRDVHYTYPSRPDAPVLRGVDLQVQAGKKTRVFSSNLSLKNSFSHF